MSRKPPQNLDPSFQRLAGIAQRDPKRLAKLIDAAWCERPGGLLKFIELMWHTVEPTRDFVPGWHLECMTDHLEAVSRGEIKRLIFNVPPGFCKSLILNVFFPAYEWGPLNNPSLRYLTFSYAQHLTVRDNVRFRQVIMSPLYRELWGDRFGPSPDQFSLVKVGNDKTGWKLASSVSGVGTGERGDRILCLEFNVKILTDRGWLKIGEIVENELDVLILSYSFGDGIVEWQPIESWQTNPSGDMVEIEIETGKKITLTTDHRVFVVGKGYVRADEIREGDELWGLEEEHGLSLQAALS